MSDTISNAKSARERDAQQSRTQASAPHVPSGAQELPPEESLALIQALREHLREMEGLLVDIKV